MSTVAAIPDPPADARRLREIAALVRSTADRFALLVQQGLLAWNLLPDLYRAPEADLVHMSLATTRPAADEIADGLTAASRALDGFADEIDDLAPRRALLLDQRDAGPPPDLWDEGAAGHGAMLNDRRRDDWASLLARDAAALEDAYDDAGRRCARELRAIADVTWTASAAWNGPEVEGPLGSVADAVGVALLSRLASSPDPARLLSEHPGWAGLLDGIAPARVAEWWTSLDPRITRLLLTRAPEVVGNLDGVPIHDRVDANRRRADEHLRELRRQQEELRAQRVPRRRTTAMEVVDRRKELRRLDREIAYFESVRDGSTSLYAWDPSHGSLIEMTGDPSSATSALFVVPGTNTDADAFMTEAPVTRFADWQVQAGGGSVLGFTVMTGPMPQLDRDVLQTGPQWNSMAEDRGVEYARFLAGIDAVRPDLWTMSYEHSYGGGVGSEAEKHGGTVDARFLAASVGAVGPYEPNPGTTYFAAQAPDDINRYYAGLGLGPAGFSVGPEAIPGVHIVDSGLPGADAPAVAGLALTGNPLYVPGIVADSVAHHTALMSDDETVNGTVLDRVRSILDNKGRSR